MYINSFLILDERFIYCVGHVCTIDKKQTNTILAPLLMHSCRVSDIMLYSRVQGWTFSSAISEHVFVRALNQTLKVLHKNATSATIFRQTVQPVVEFEMSI